MNPLFSDFARYLATCVAEDGVDFETHDRRYHGGLFDAAKMTCEMRNALEVGDIVDVMRAEEDEREGLNRRIRKEAAEVVAWHTNPNGTMKPSWLCAPDGNASNLVKVLGKEEGTQAWVLVRTPTFKKWFGDWELIARARAVESLTPIKILRDTTREEAEHIYKALPNAINAIDGREIRFVNTTFGKIVRHKGYPTERIVPQLCAIFRDSIPIGFEEEKEKPGHKAHRNFVGYHTYIGKIKDSIGGGAETEYFVRFTIQQLKTRKKDFVPNELHSTFVSEIAIYDKSEVSALNTTNGVGKADDLGLTDDRVAQFFAEVNRADKKCSKILDDNGEPRVLYHGSNKGGLKELRDGGKGIWLAFDREHADMYSEGSPDGRTYECFAVMRNPMDVREKVDSAVLVSSKKMDGREASAEELGRIAEMLGVAVPELLARHDGELVDDIVSSPAFREFLRSRGYDGFVGYMQGEGTAMPLDSGQVAILGHKDLFASAIDEALKGRRKQMNTRGFERYLASGEYVVAQDAAPEGDMEKHDKRFHPEGFNPLKDTCKFREKLEQGDKSDKQTDSDKEKKPKESAKFLPYLDMSGTQAYNWFMVTKDPESREVLMSDGTYKDYDKLQGNDHPFMSDRSGAEEAAKKHGASIASNNSLRNGSKWYWVRKDDTVLTSNDNWQTGGKPTYQHSYLGDLHNTSADKVFTTRDLAEANKMAAEHGGQVELAPDWQLDKVHDRFVYEGYDKLPTRQSERHKKMQQLVQEEVDGVLAANGLKDAKFEIMRQRDGSEADAAIVVSGIVDGDEGRKLPDYLYGHNDHGKVHQILKGISAALDRKGFCSVSSAPGGVSKRRLTEEMWRKLDTPDGRTVFYQNISSPEFVKGKEKS